MASQHRSRRTSHRNRNILAFATFEALERRQLMTTLGAGGTFEFRDQDGNLQRVLLTGGGTGTADLIGGTVFAVPTGGVLDQGDGRIDGQATQLNDIPGRLTTAGGDVIDILGGIGGQDGIEPIQVITGAADSFTNILNLGVPDGPNSAGINLSAIASNSTGRTYAMQVRTIPGSNPPQKSVDLLSLNYRGNGEATAVGNLAVDIAIAVGASGTDKIAAIRGAEFRPGVDNILYFVGIVNVPRFTFGQQQQTPADAPIPFLFSFNLNTQVTQEVGEFTSDDVNPGFSNTAPNVGGIAFTPDGNLLTFGTARRVTNQGTGIQGFAAETGLITCQLITNNPVTPGDFGEFATLFTFNRGSANDDVQPIIDDDGAAVTDLRGLVVTPGDNEFVYGINGADADSRLLHIRRSDGKAQNYGSVVDPDPGPSGITRGESLLDLTFNTKLASPFIDASGNVIGKRGVFLSADTNTDELVVIDPRNRFPSTNLFSIYLNNTTRSNNLIIGSYTPNDDDDNDLANADNPMEPFTDTAGNIRIRPSGGGNLIDQALPGNSGRTYIGARTRDFGANDDTDNIPIRRVRKSKTTVFGALPAGKAYLTAGIQVQGDIGSINIGGTLTGNFIVSGSIDQLYSNVNLIGDAAGRSPGNTDDLIGCFNVGGSIGQVIVRDTFGGLGNGGLTAQVSTPTYLTGFDMVVGGSIGDINALNSFFGSVRAYGRSQLDAAQNEFENRSVPAGAGQNFDAGQIVEPGQNNDTFANAQALGSATTLRAGGGTAVVNGTLQNRISNNPLLTDYEDYYSVALLAGQTVTVQLNSAFGQGRVGVFDPDNRQIASDFNLRDPVGAAGTAFQFTADRPGSYRFAVANLNDANFTGPSRPVGGSLPYTLTLAGLNNLSLGGLQADNIIHYASGVAGVRLDRGDLGTVQARGGFLYNLTGDAYNIAKGNLREIIGPSIGKIQNNTYGFGADALVPNGSIGLLRATDPAGVLEFNDDLLAVDTTVDLPVTANAAGFDIQLVDGAGTTAGNFMANRAIGVIRAGNMATNTASNIIANANLENDDGTIDLIDVNGQVGTLAAGGPSIRTGPGGNLRYFHVPTGPNGPTVDIYRSAKFGQGFADFLTSAGTPVTVTDDSGTPITITPTPLITQVGQTFEDELVNPGSLSVLFYGTDDSVGGGGAIISAQVISPGNANAGIVVTSGSNGGSGGAEIGSLIVRNSGTRSLTRAIRTTDDDGVPIDADDQNEITITSPGDPDPDGITGPSLGTPTRVVFTGKARVDVFDLRAYNQGGAPSLLDSVDNQTGGELVNARVGAIGALRAQSIGIASSHTGTDRGRQANTVQGVVTNINGILGSVSNPLGTTFARNAFIVGEAGSVGGNAIGTLTAAQGIGNIFVRGTIGNILANSDGRNVRGVFEGINGPVYVADDGSQFGGYMGPVSIGEGISRSGSGAVALSGLFADSRIESVNGTNADIRGAIIGGAVGGGGFGDRGIGSINLRNGSILGATISAAAASAAVGFPYDVFRQSGGLRTLTFTGGTLDNPTYGLGSINITGGAGGVIGSYIEAYNAGPVNIDGYGFLNSEIISTSGGTIAGVITNGYGIRNSEIGAAANVTNLIAKGGGKQIPVTNYAASARASSYYTDFDPNTGRRPDALTDLNFILGVSDAKPTRKNSTVSGRIGNVTANGNRSLINMQAYSISNTTLNFSNTVDNVAAAAIADTLNITTGTLGKLATGGELSKSAISVSGRARQISVGGSIKGDTRILGRGTNGRIDNIYTKLGLLGQVVAGAGIGSITVGTDLGSARIQAVRGGLDSLTVGRDVLTGANVNVATTLGNLVIKGNLQDASTIRASAITNQAIGGKIEGDIVIA